MYATLTKWHTLERINVVFNTDSIKNILQGGSGKIYSESRSIPKIYLFQEQKSKPAEIRLRCMSIEFVPFDKSGKTNRYQVGLYFHPWAGCVIQPSDLSRITLTCPPKWENWNEVRDRTFVKNFLT